MEDEEFYDCLEDQIEELFDEFEKEKTALERFREYLYKDRKNESK